MGHALLKSEERDEVTSTGLWHLDGPERFETFRRVTEALSFGGGVGLPGRVLEDGAPIWVPDVTRDGNFPRNRLVHDLGLRAAFAFPILSGREVAGVLEFYCTRQADPDEAMLAVMHQVGVQLGRAVERRRAEQTLTTLAQDIVVHRAEDFFRTIVAHLSRSVKSDYALIGEIKQERDAVGTLAVCAGGEFLPNFEYDLTGTPCAGVVNRGFCSYPAGVRKKFPHDGLLAELEAETYVGTPLPDTAGRPLGILIALWGRPPASMKVAESMVQIFAVRAAAELERKRAEETAQKLAELPRANPHPILEFSGDGALRFCNAAAHVLARSLGKGDPIHILPADTTGIVRRSPGSGKSGIVVDTLEDQRTIIWSFIPIVKNDSVFAHAFELTLFLNLHEGMRRLRGLRAGPPTDGRRRHGDPGRPGSAPPRNACTERASRVPRPARPPWSGRGDRSAAPRPEAPRTI